MKQPPSNDLERLAVVLGLMKMQQLQNAHNQTNKEKENNNKK